MTETKVTIIIRTCNRPHVLRNALESVRRQTYKNIEVVLVEDGENVSEALVKEFSDLEIKYCAMNSKCGRTAVGNRALQMASGEYLNFLDDDDILLPDHVALLIECLQNGTCQAAYAVAEEHQIVKRKDGDVTVKRKFVRYRYPFNRLLLFYMNYFPIQSVMFSRKLYEELGGFDENLDELEDWDLWVRYATRTEFTFLDKVTSVYYTPYREERSKRENALKTAEENVKKKHFQYAANLSVGQINQDMDYILNVFNQKGYIFYMRKIRNWLLYRDR